MKARQAFPSLHLSLSEPSPHAWPICRLVTTQDSVQLALSLLGPFCSCHRDSSGCRNFRDYLLPPWTLSVQPYLCPTQDHPHHLLFLTLPHKDQAHYTLT